MEGYSQPVSMKTSSPHTGRRVWENHAPGSLSGRSQNVVIASIHVSKLCRFDFVQGLLQYYDDLCQEVPSVFVNLMTPKMKKVGDAGGS